MVKTFISSVYIGSHQIKTNKKAANLIWTPHFCIIPKYNKKFYLYQSIEINYERQYKCFILQRLLKIHHCNVTKDSFQLACQNQDLGILKFLVHKVRSKQYNPTDLEQKPMTIESNNWLDWLYNPKNNIFLKEIMNQDSEMAKFLRRVYKEEFQNDFTLTDMFTSEEQASSSKTDDLHNAKALHELQVLDASFSMNLDLNSSLNICQTLDLMVYNNKKYFCNPENLKTSSIPIISAALSIYPNEFGGIQLNQSLFQALQDSNVHLVSSYFEHFPILKNDMITLTMCHFALQTNSLAILSYLNTNFPLIYQELLLELTIGTMDKESNYHKLNKVHSYIPVPSESGVENTKDSLLDFLITTDLMSSHIIPIIYIQTSIDHHNNSPLHLSAKRGFAKIVKILLEKGADTSRTNNFRQTALHYAAEEGHEEVTRILIENKANVNAKNYAGYTPLHIASIENHYKVAELLLRHRADINANNLRQETPLHLAAEWGNLEVTEVLLKYGASKNLKNNDGNTPLKLAEESDFSDIKVIAILK